MVIATSFSGDGPSMRRLRPLMGLPPSPLETITLLSGTGLDDESAPMQVPLEGPGDPDVETGGMQGGGGDERRDTSADTATVVSSLRLKLSLTKSERLLAARKQNDDY